MTAHPDLVTEPIINSPYCEPEAYWHVRHGEPAIKEEGRRPAYIFQPAGGGADWDLSDGTLVESRHFDRAYELALVNRIRGQVKAWREAGYPGASGMTLELLRYWQRDGRLWPLFFAQLEAAETIIFLAEARDDFRQGINVPRDIEASDGTWFRRHACKMATGTGKTTVMGMLAAWSILNKLNSRGDARFSDVVLIVCPNVTIRNQIGRAH
ncbi:MAG: restriction endonuclease, partial [Planctomycetota bacterium]